MSNVRSNSGKLGYSADLVTPWGQTTVSLTEAQVAAYEVDPDGFAASHFGFDLRSYREWLDMKGAPLCSGVTRASSRCANSVAPSQLPADQWKELHRKARCHAH